MPEVYVPRYYTDAIITGYVIEPGKKEDTMFEKLVYVMPKKDGGMSKECKLRITTGKRMCLKGIQESLTPIIGDMKDWGSLVGKTLNIPVKIMLLKTKKDPEGFGELALHSTKPTIIHRATPDPVWTDAEIEAIRPVGQEPQQKSTMGDAAPVVNTDTSF
jgi:hypothetical protein